MTMEDRQRRLRERMDRPPRGEDGELHLKEVFRSHGAVSAATAAAGKDLPEVDAATFDRLLRSGAIREGAPGTFYLYEKPPAPFSARRFFSALLFFGLLSLVPMIVLQYCGGPR